MVRKRLIWSDAAEQELNRILRFFKQRNGNNIYSKKLRAVFRRTVMMIKNDEEIGMKYKEENIRYTIVKGTYQLFYEITENQITILKVWDARRDPDELKL